MLQLVGFPVDVQLVFFDVLCEENHVSIFFTLEELASHKNVNIQGKLALLRIITPIIKIHNNNPNS